MGKHSQVMFFICFVISFCSVFLQAAGEKRKKLSEVHVAKKCPNIVLLQGVGRTVPRDRTVISAQQFELRAEKITNQLPCQNMNSSISKTMLWPRWVNIFGMGWAFLSSESSG